MQCHLEVRARRLHQSQVRQDSRPARQHRRIGSLRVLDQVNIADGSEYVGDDGRVLLEEEQGVGVHLSDKFVANDQFERVTVEVQSDILFVRL